MKYLPNIPYLEGRDFNTDGSLKNYVTKGKPVIVMCQGLFCGYCTQAKPAFAKFSNNDQVRAATIQIDGGDGDRDAAKYISKLDKSYRGVPVYLCFNKDGKYIKTHDKGRDEQSLLSTARNL